MDPTTGGAAVTVHHEARRTVAVKAPCVIALGVALLAYAYVHVALAGEGLLRTTLLVEDVARSIAWYEQAGFRVERQLGGDRDPSSAFPLASASTRFNLHILAFPGGTGGRLGLLQFGNPQPPRVHTRQDQVGIGSMVLVVDVVDAQTVFTRLRQAGADLITPQPTPIQRDSDDGMTLLGYVFHAFDPDGNLVEFMQAPTPTIGPSVTQPN